MLAGALEEGVVEGIEALLSRLCTRLGLIKKSEEVAPGP